MKKMTIIHASIVGAWHGKNAVTYCEQCAARSVFAPTSRRLNFNGDAATVYQCQACHALVAIVGDRP